VQGTPMTCGTWAAKTRMDRALTKPTMTLRGMNRMSLATPATASRIWNTPASMTVAMNMSIPCSRATGAMTSATAPVAAEIMAGRPPRKAIETAMMNAENRPTLGSTPAMIENAIASGMRARPTTSPARTSRVSNLGDDSADRTEGSGRQRRESSVSRAAIGVVTSGTLPDGPRVLTAGPRAGTCVGPRASVQADSGPVQADRQARVRGLDIGELETGGQEVEVDDDIGDRRGQEAGQGGHVDLRRAQSDRCRVDRGASALGLRLDAHEQVLAQQRALEDELTVNGGERHRLRQRGVFGRERIECGVGQDRGGIDGAERPRGVGRDVVEVRLDVGEVDTVVLRPIGRDGHRVEFAAGQLGEHGEAFDGDIGLTVVLQALGDALLGGVVDDAIGGDDTDDEGADDDDGGDDEGAAATLWPAVRLMRVFAGSGRGHGLHCPSPPRPRRQRPIYQRGCRP